MEDTKNLEDNQIIPKKNKMTIIYDGKSEKFNGTEDEYLNLIKKELRGEDNVK